MFAFLQLVNGFLGAVFGIISVYLMWCVIGPQLTRSQDIRAMTSQPRPRYLSATSHTMRQPVVMEDVWFRYSPDTPWILEGYCLKVMPGEKRMLRSASGSGKSTVLRLLAGLYTPEKGIISIGGISPAAAQQHMLYLPQFARLYVGSIIENLRILSGGASWERIIDAAKTTGLHELVSALPMNYATVLPPGGYSLSGGQRQLVVLTAVIASGRPLVLLDEAMANMDAAASSRLMELVTRAPWTAVMAAHGGLGIS